MKQSLIGILLGVLILSLLAGCSKASENEEATTKDESSFDGEVIEVIDDGTIIHYLLNDEPMYDYGKFVYFVSDEDTNQYEVGQQIRIDVTTYGDGMIRIMESNPPQLQIESIKIK